MEKNYRLTIYKDYDPEHPQIECFEELGQAIIAAKCFGHGMLVQDKCSAQYSWRIFNYGDNEPKSQIVYIIGEFDREWNPIITEIKTEQ